MIVLSNKPYLPGEWLLIQKSIWIWAVLSLQNQETTIIGAYDIHTFFRSGAAWKSGGVTDSR